MVFRCRKQSVQVCVHSRGASATPIVTAVACFAVLLGVLWVALGGWNSSSEDRSSQQRANVAKNQKKEIDESSSRQSRNTSTSTPEKIAESDAGLATREVADKELPKTAEPKSAPTQEEKVSAQLAAGEFSSALETAVQTVDVKEQARLLKQIADAQMEIGDFDAALKTIRRIPDPRARSRANGENAVQKSLAGGGAMADWELLKTLIKSAVDENALWFDDDDEGGTMEEYPSGVRVDPNGLLYRLTREEHHGRLNALGHTARKADLNEDMAQPSSLRLVSLTRLEKEIARRLADGEPVLETMKHLAGLSKIQYVFIYPEEKEIVIGGPAEGWVYNEQGTPLGIESGRPTLQLDDFVTVLRTFSPGGFGAFQCLIVPRQEGLKRVNDFVKQSQANGPLRRGGTARFAKQVQQRLGLNSVVVRGVSLNSRVARVIVEADYRMKLIGIDKLDAGGDIPSYFDLLSRNFSEAPASMNALRWWLTMKYDSILHSPDRNVFEISGSSVQCLSENELITADGNRIHTGKAGPVNRLFAQNFTKHYDQLAQRDPVFAELQNVFDLALVSALIRREQADERIGWDHGVFANDGDYHTAVYAPADSVMSVFNHRVYRGKDVVVQVAGGVRGDLMKIVKNDKMFQENSRLGSVSKRSRAPKLPEGRWWWDASK